MGVQISERYQDNRKEKLFPNWYPVNVLEDIQTLEDYNFQNMANGQFKINIKKDVRYQLAPKRNYKGEVYQE